MARRNTQCAAHWLVTVVSDVRIAKVEGERQTLTKIGADWRQASAGQRNLGNMESAGSRLERADRDDLNQAPGAETRGAMKWLAESIPSIPSMSSKWAQPSPNWPPTPPWR